MLTLSVDGHQHRVVLPHMDPVRSMLDSQQMTLGERPS
jgi:hypothetical protein